MAKTKTVTEKANRKFTAEDQIFAMWKKTSKKDETYFTGSLGKEDLRGFFNTEKKNPNEPDVKIYTVDKEKNLSKEPILVLWCNATEKGKKYLSGKLEEKRVVGFINEKATEENRQPYFSVYYSDDKPAEEKEEMVEKKEPF